MRDEGPLGGIDTRSQGASHMVALSYHWAGQMLTDLLIPEKGPMPHGLVWWAEWEGRRGRCLTQSL